MLTAVEPPVRIEIAACEPVGVSGRWRVTWRVVNVSPVPVAIAEAWVPHGRFRGDGHLPLNVVIAPRESHLLEVTVNAQEEPGTLVENAFLILRTAVCRVFVRMTVKFSDTGRPWPVIEAVTAQSLE
jgi:hypothetical protein